MAYFSRTTGQGQGLAQVVNQVGDSSVDYLEQERNRQEAAAKKQSMMSKMDYLGRNLSGVYKAGFNQTLEDIRSKAVSGELDAKTAVELLDMEAKNLKSMQDEALKYSKEDRRNQISWENDMIKNPDIYLYEQSFNQENYENPYDIIQSNVDLITRTEDYPESIDQQFYKRYMPLLRENKNIVTSEELQGIGDDDELLTAIKNQTISYSPEALDKLKEEYIGDEEVLRRIALENNLYEIKDGMVDVTDLNAVQKIAEDFFDSMTKPKSKFTEQQRKDTGKGGGGKGITEQDLSIAKEVKEKVNNFQDTRQLNAINKFLAPYNLSVGVTGDIVQFSDSNGNAKSSEIKIDDAESIYRFLSKNVPDIKLEAINQVEFKDPTPAPIGKNKQDIEFMLKAYENKKIPEAKELAKTFGDDVEYVSSDEIKIGDESFDPSDNNDVEKIFNLLQNRERKTKETTTRQDLNEREAERRGEKRPPLSSFAKPKQ